MTEQEIKMALKMWLDPLNDAHWTKGGLPRLDIIRELLADTSITRADVHAAEPGFTREVARPVSTGICGHMFNGKCQLNDFVPTGPCHCSQDTR